MDKVYTLPQPLGEISSFISGLSYEDQNIVKINNLASIPLVDFSLSGIDVKIIGKPRVNGIMLEVNILAFKNGTPLRVDNPYQYINPDITVPDGTWVQVKDFNGNFMDIPNYKEDLLAAFQNQIIQTIKTVNTL